MSLEHQGHWNSTMSFLAGGRGLRAWIYTPPSSVAPSEERPRPTCTLRSRTPRDTLNHSVFLSSSCHLLRDSRAGASLFLALTFKDPPSPTCDWGPEVHLLSRLGAPLSFPATPMPSPSQASRSILGRGTHVGVGSFTSSPASVPQQLDVSGPASQFQDAS